MNRKKVVENCIQLIDRNYYFINNQQKEWEQKKSRILFEAENAESEDDAIEVLEKYIYEFHDPHTRLFYKAHPEYIISEAFYFDHGVLWCCIGDKYKKVLSVNDIKISNLINEYQTMLCGYPIALIEDEIVKDIQLLQHKFKCNYIRLCCEFGEEICLYPTLFSQWLKDIHSLTQDKSLEPIYIERIDHKTICIKILSFRVHELYNQLKQKIEMYNDNYSTVILDIRNNMGGYIEEAKQIVGGIIKNRVNLDYSISCIKSGFRTESECEITPIEDRLFNNKKIFVFINYRTMSAAEYIFAKALQRDNICIVGEKSAGLKDQAEVFIIDEEITLQITTKRFIKNGNYMNEKMVPDIYIAPDVAHPGNEDPYVMWYKQLNTQVAN